MQSEVFEALRSINIAEDKAMAAAGALARPDENISIIKGEIGAIKSDVAAIKIDVTAVKGEMALTRWMLGFLLALQVAILFKVFSH